MKKLNLQCTYPENPHEHVKTYDYEDLEILDAKRQYQAEVQFQKMYFPLIAEELAGARSMLDIGCGTGHLLERVGSYSSLYRAGIELNQARATVARSKANCDIFQIPVEEFEPERKFDVITMINVLSHIPNFDRLFGTLRTLLAPQGKLILKVGEMKKNIEKGDIFDWQIPDHLHFLGLGTIDYLCSRYGFKVLKHRRAPLSHDLFSSSYFKSPGRNRIRNTIKGLAAHTPLVLTTLAKLYDLRTGQRLYSSFIVLENA